MAPVEEKVLKTPEEQKLVYTFATGISTLAVSLPELLVAAVGSFTIGKVVLSFSVPFLAQLGLGATLGPSAIRAVIVGSVDLSVATLATAVGFVPVENAGKLLAAAYVAQPLTTGLVYSSIQYITKKVGSDFYASEGFSRDFTFATLSSVTSSAVSGGLALAVAGTLFSVRFENLAAEDDLLASTVKGKLRKL